jgi:hypothetical protein
MKESAKAIKISAIDDFFRGIDQKYILRDNKSKLSSSRPDKI